MAASGRNRTKSSATAEELLEGRDCGTFHITGINIDPEHWRELYEDNVKHALNEARAGRFEILADMLRRCGDPHIDGKPLRVHEKIVAWVEEGCPVVRERGNPGRNPALENRIWFYYQRARSEYSTREVSEKALLLWILEKLSHFDPRYPLNYERVRAIVRKKEQQHASARFPDAKSPNSALARIRNKRAWYRVEHSAPRHVANAAWAICMDKQDCVASDKLTKSERIAVESLVRLYRSWQR